MKIRLSLWFWIGVLLLLLYNHADYLWQGSMHGWTTWLDLSYRAPKWPGVLDAIPHDGWHLVQSIKNHSLLFGAPCVFYGFKHSYHGPWPEFAAIVIVYAVTRGIGFTLFLP